MVMENTSRSSGHRPLALGMLSNSSEERISLCKSLSHSLTPGTSTIGALPSKREGNGSPTRRRRVGAVLLRYSFIARLESSTSSSSLRRLRRAVERLTAAGSSSTAGASSVARDNLNSSPARALMRAISSSPSPISPSGSISGRNILLSKSSNGGSDISAPPYTSESSKAGISSSIPIPADDMDGLVRDSNDDLTDARRSPLISSISLTRPVPDAVPALGAACISVANGDAMPGVPSTVRVAMEGNPVPRDVSVRINISTSSVVVSCSCARVRPRAARNSSY
mmetsp:Transcript_14752/g.22240  ORF Transcript_14752/g.22240 Transcript_14752/m.22240 type:complete len:282 (+) Transcript_14752:908-1753(+)